MVHSVPKVAAVQDISCFGRCSLTVIMPVLATLGIQVCPLPTAVLSTHLGGFKDLAFCDFTEHMRDFSRHWQQESITFDAIYSGFLASERQIEIVQDFIDTFAKPGLLVLVDPVMGDGGKLYSTYTPAMQNKMKMLVGKAGVITPNYTEACFLLGESYQAENVDMDTTKKWLVRLADLGPEQVVITGVPCSGQKVANIAYDRNCGETWELTHDFIPVSYPGTGDIFASVLLGLLLGGRPLPKAMAQAARFVAKAIDVTVRARTPVREGILLEKVLSRLYSI
jgi:pyridoxine kinase